MTGYGRVKVAFADKAIVVEIRSLNSKFTDLRIKAPQNYREKEPEIRRILTERLERGKIDFTLEVQSEVGEEGFGLNVALFKKYARELRRLSDELNIPPGDFLQAILRLPNVISAGEDDLDDDEWQAATQAIEEAIQKFDAFRLQEGAVIEEDMQQRIEFILAGLDQVTPFEEERVTKLRQRLFQSLEEYLGKDKVDENRFEQEILFYLEKMDVTEEKVRLEQHCRYFLEELKKKYSPKGRKLSFISQEMGREINTLGAKAYSSDIQRVVVGMKDELEKIKEQIANTL
ncbi:MAG: YicC family protein [Lewinellaceae bacterium]|nr:YicC family protein [Lewinellaceae bacterium]